MDSVKSFNPYGKVNDLQEQTFRRNSRRRCIIIALSSVILLALIIGAVAGTLIHKKTSDSNSVPASPLTPKSALQSICSVTEYPDSCFSSMSLKSSSNTTDPENIFILSLQIAVDELSKLTGYPSKLLLNTNDSRVQAALTLCESLFDDALYRLNNSISSMKVKDGEKILTSTKINDLKTWLSTTITDQETCLDGLRDANYTLVYEVENYLKNSTIFTSNSLAIVTKILGLLSKFKIPIHRRLLANHGYSNEFPDWMSAGDRRLLQEVIITPNVTVAQDGTGNYKTIMEAIQLVPTKNNSTRFVIYIKEGVYKEKVNIDKSMWNIMMYGDGKNRTIVTGSLNFVDGTPTFTTASFAVVGQGFIARDMGFKNTAGPEKHQAVALRSGSDKSVFYRCSFDAFQDTLYTHSNRQFYRECDIIGTIDFIFGNAAVVLQNCSILPRQPLSGQFITVTAQGKSDRNQNTGISIQKCTIFPFDNVTASTYLGRPWKNYSTTIVMQSNIASFLNPLGWAEWIRGVTPPSTIYYAEYQNTGLGSNLDGRVTWSGYKRNITENEAGKFTVGTFIQGGDWLPATKVTFDASM